MTSYIEFKASIQESFNDKESLAFAVIDKIQPVVQSILEAEKAGLFTRKLSISLINYNVEAFLQAHIKDRHSIVNLMTYYLIYFLEKYEMEQQECKNVNVAE